MSKVYVFYLRKNASNKPCNQLYAIAQNKSERDYFKRIRDMNRFDCVKYEDLSDVIKTHSNIKDTYSKYILNIVAFKTSSNICSKGYTHIDIQTTWDEEEKTILWYDQLYDYLNQFSLPILKIFDKDTQKNLKKINYHKFIKWSSRDRVPIAYVDRTKYIEVVDEFKIFMKLYGYTMMK